MERFISPLLGLIILLTISLPAHALNNQQVFGWVERVQIMQGQLTLKAKLDTGAATSSLDATNIHLFKRGGKSYVRFTIADPQSGELMTLEKPRLRRVRIKRHNGQHQRRPVIEIDICLGHNQRTVEVNLINRSQFIYPLLLGRSALDGIAVIDPSDTFLSKPNCHSTNHSP